MPHWEYLHVLCDATYDDPLVYMVGARRIFDPLPISKYESALKAEGWELVERSETDDFRVSLVFKRPKG